jgi:hypothetical protein
MTNSAANCFYSQVGADQRVRNKLTKKGTAATMTPMSEIALPTAFDRRAAQNAPNSRIIIPSIMNTRAIGFITSMPLGLI